MSICRPSRRARRRRLLRRYRPGDDLFAESIVALDAKTGKRVWHFQTVHHGLWDFDLGAAPNLVDITVDGQRIKALAQVTKQNFVYVLDRVTGKPVWPIEERPVPKGDVPDEWYSPTQPIPDQAAGLRPAGRHDRRSDRFHAGAARRSDQDHQPVPLRPAVHAAVAARCGKRHTRDHSQPGHGRERVQRCRLRS